MSDSIDQGLLAINESLDFIIKTNRNTDTSDLVSKLSMLVRLIEHVQMEVAYVESMGRRKVTCAESSEQKEREE